MILRNQHPQLFEFMKKNRKSFENFFNPDNNDLLTLLQNNSIENKIVDIENENSENKADYTFDGVYFENIEKIGAFSPIINFKNAIKQENDEKQNECVKILENQHPQLYTFLLKYEKSFMKFFELDNNALLTLTPLEKAQQWMDKHSTWIIAATIAVY